MKQVYKTFTLISLIIAIGIFAGSVFLIYLPVYERVILALSFATFILFGFDKFMAINQSDRVPEKILYLLILLGGFIGGWLGMIFFRHKKRKLGFILILLFATILHLGYYFRESLFLI